MVIAVGILVTNDIIKFRFRPHYVVKMLCASTVVVQSFRAMETKKNSKTIAYWTRRASNV